MMYETGLSGNRFLCAAGVDIGAKRSTNQDEVIACPELGFFAVSDGMGGLYGGGETSSIIAGALPGLIREAGRQLEKNASPKRAAALLDELARTLSDNIYSSLNRVGKTAYGATLCGVWLVGEHAVFVNIGDSRGYLLGFYKRCIEQITIDHNVAAALVASGELRREDAPRHPASASLTRFVGMRNPALPEVFIRRVERGDRILLCSDGLYGMVEDIRLPKLLRVSKSPARVVERLIGAANEAGGRDNISAIYIRVYGPANAPGKGAETP